MTAKILMRLLPALALLALPSASPAQSGTAAARADGKAFGNAKASAAQAAATATPDATRIPNFSNAPQQSIYFATPDQMAPDAVQATATHDGYRTMQSSLNTRARFAPVDIDATIARGKTVSADPLAYTSGMSAGGTQGNCVPLPPSSASPGRYTATCNTGYSVAQATLSCPITLAVSVTQTRTYSYYAENPYHTGIAPSMGEFQPAITAGICQVTGPADPCQVVRDYGFQPNSRCSRFLFNIVNCSAEPPGLSGIAFPATGQLWFAQTTSGTASTSRDQSQCATLAADSACTQQAEVCTDSAPVTRIVGGVSVTQPCWAWDRTYQCNRLASAQDCTALDATPGCTFVSENCITDELPCLTFERVYDCPLPAVAGPSNQFICDGDIYCIDGACETISREANDEFKDAVVALNAMDQANKEFDPANLTLFKGERGTCSSKVFGVLNCCKGKGFPLIPGISLLVALGCDSEEVLLHQRDAQGLCAYVGTYCSSKVLGVCTTKRKAYCCFESKLSRILQEQGRIQLNKPWGKPRTEQCAGFTIDEFAQLDLSIMDFSEVYAEFTAAARLPDELTAAQDIQQKIEAYYASHTP